MKETAKILAETNEYNYNILKTIEELNELSLILTQMLTKGAKHQDIIDEIGDVKIRIQVLDNLFDKEAIDKRVNHKINKFKGYIEQGKYIGRI